MKDAPVVKAKTGEASKQELEKRPRFEVKKVYLQPAILA